VEPVQALLSQAGLGVVAGVALWLYISEKKENSAKDAKIAELQEARRLDAVETRTDVTQVLTGISQNLSSLNDKIVISKDRQRKK
jgi:hypothetical protein